MNLTRLGSIAAKKYNDSVLSCILDNFILVKKNFTKNPRKLHKKTIKE